MITLGNIVEVLASGLQVDETEIAWLVRKLQAADLLPEEDGPGELTALHGARLLVALLAAGRPIDAAAAVAAYERAPAIHMIRTDGRRELDRTLIEDVQVPAGGGSAVAALSRNFVGAVAWFLERAAVDPTTPLPALISARRSFDLPLGVLVDIPPQAADPTKTLTFVYGRRDDTGISMGGAMLEVYAAAPGAIVQALADLLCPTGRRTQERHSEAIPAQVRWPANLDGGNAGRRAMGN